LLPTDPPLIRTKPASIGLAEKAHSPEETGVKDFLTDEGEEPGDEDDAGGLDRVSKNDNERSHHVTLGQRTTDARF
jgi:hypothetical protein